MNIKPGMPIPSPLLRISKELIDRDPVISDKIYLDNKGLSEEKKEEIIKLCNDAFIEVEFLSKAIVCIAPPISDLSELFQKESKPHYRYIDYLQKKYKRKDKI